MLKKLKEFGYFEPSTLSEAIFLLGRYDSSAKILSGGTDLLVGMKEKGLSPECLINIKGVPNLSYIKYNEREGLKIGALTTIREIEKSNLINKKFSVLTQAAEVLGSVQVRNRATIGGNLCNAAPSAEMVPGLLVLDAEVKITGKKGERVLPLEKFFLGPGLTVLGKEILTEIRVPSPHPNTKEVYIKHGRRKAMNIAVVGVAVAAILSGDKKEFKNIKIALGAVAPTPVRAHKAEEILRRKKIEVDLIEKAAQIASEEVRPISDIRSSDWYRKEMIKVLVRRALEQVLKNSEEKK